MGALAALTGILGTANQAGEAGNEVRQEKEAKAQKLHQMNVEDAYLQLAKQADARQAESQKQAIARGDLYPIKGRLWSVSQGKFIDTGQKNPYDVLKDYISQAPKEEQAELASVAKMTAEGDPEDPKAAITAVLNRHKELKAEADRRADATQREVDRRQDAITTEQHRREDKETAVKIHREDMESARQARFEDRKSLMSFAKGLAGQKPSADEIRRADLAENVNENLDAIEEIVTRRPELFGPAKGLITSMRGKIGTSDEDIAALEQARDNLGRALQGAHGMRSATGVLSAGNSVLNNFRNSDKAVLSAIKRARGSVQTFISDVQRKAQGGQQGPVDIDKVLDDAFGKVGQQ